MEAGEEQLEIQELYQRVTLYAIKTGIIGKKIIFDAGEYLNKQIETLYLFIEEIIMKKQENIEKIN